MSESKIAPLALEQRLNEKRLAKKKAADNWNSETDAERRKSASIFRADGSKVIAPKPPEVKKKGRQ